MAKRAVNLGTDSIFLGIHPYAELTAEEITTGTANHDHRIVREIL